MKLSAPVHTLRSRAKKLKKEQSVTLVEAQNLIAQQEGFGSWSLLIAQQDNLLPNNPAELIDYLNEGDMVLVGARPRLGKTLFTSSLIAEASRAGHPPGAYFTLVDLEVAARERIHNHLVAEGLSGDEVYVDCSDDICAEYIIARLESRPVRGALVVVDYLQLLSEKKQHTPLDEQLGLLKSFAKTSGCKILMLTQLDRQLDLEPDQCPTLASVRLPNPVDLTRFNKVIFLYRKSSQSHTSCVALVTPKAHEFELEIESSPLRMVEAAG